MTVLDASALISFLARQPAAERVAELLRAGDVAITAVNLAETVDRMERIEGYPPQELRAAAERLIEAGLVVLEVSRSDGHLAGELRAHHYHHRQRPISIADCVLLAAALNRRARVATSDAGIVRLARELSMDVLPLPNSAGRLP